MLEGCPIPGHFPIAYLAAISSTFYQATIITTTRPRDFGSVQELYYHVCSFSQEAGLLTFKTFKLAGSAKNWCVPLKMFSSLKVLLKRLHLLSLHHHRKPTSFYNFVLTLHHKQMLAFLTPQILFGFFVKSILVP